MAWKGIDALSASGRGRTIAEEQVFIDKLPSTSWASGMVLHNTAAPNLKQWTPTNRAQRILNLERYFRDDRGWSSAPHAFVDDEFIWNFTPFIERGTHSPSWNGTKLGIEMVGDFDVESDETGRGALVIKNTVALFAMLHTKYGWDPDGIRLHKEDPRTTHDCPGKNVNKQDFINMVREYMGEGGEHVPIPDTTDGHIQKFKLGTVAVPLDDTLTLRAGSSASSERRGGVPNGIILKVLSESMNGKTKWYRVETPAGFEGWVNAAYVTINP